MTKRSERCPNELPSMGDEPFRFMLDAMGFDSLHDDGLKNTPRRLWRMYLELLSGYFLEPKDVLGTEFESDGYDEIVVLKNYEFASLCEHHMLPFTGIASVAYLPGRKIVGLSKLGRLVEMHARRLQVQECMTKDIATDLDNTIKPRAVAVVIEAHHHCMGCRGVNKPSARMVTSWMAGAYRENPAARDEVLRLIGY